MAYLITGGTVVTLGENNQLIDDGAVYIEDGKIGDVGTTAELTQKYDVDVELDARGKVVMPGFICAHHHFYSSMARGFAPPGEPAFTFKEILERLWWKVDKALTAEDVRYSALVALVECIRNGTTTIIDHHASPSCRDGSLDIIADAVLEAGVRASLCYEVSDRNVPGAGVDESRRWLARLKAEPSDQLAGMVGIHASLTVSDDTLAKCREVAEEFGAGYHIHVAEGTEDLEQDLSLYGKRTVERLVDLGICGDNSIFVHCININEHEMALIEETGTTVVHNPESNMNNGVGVARVLEMMDRGITVGLGTDGMSSDMLAQMRCAFLVQRLAQKDPRVAFVEAPTMLLWNNATIANRYFPVELGVIKPGAPADLAVIDYWPPTALTADNFLGHLLFGMIDAVVDTTIASGKFLMKNKKIVGLDEEKIAAESRRLAAKMWPRIQ